jgi:hypothetical protein
MMLLRCLFLSPSISILNYLQRSCKPQYSKTSWHENKPGRNTLYIRGLKWMKLDMTVECQLAAKCQCQR